ncbi:MAG: 4Fe-4S binding protein [Prevotellaceae bacterium]|jgi:electron transport complex protein RnfB|nr:4Fe-4S binding protein [Prevotellaceae bacterium]
MATNPISRKQFLRQCGSIAAGAAIISVSGIAVKQMLKKDGDNFWQIDPSKCTFCGRCATSCVLTVSAVKCIHANKVCGYCDLCGGYYRANVKDLNTAAENLKCPTGAIFRKYIEDPYFEYTIDEDLCNGCGKCAKGCNSFGNGSLYLQVKQELCKNCNECKISKVCPSDAIQRVSADKVYMLKDG